MDTDTEEGKAGVFELRLANLSAEDKRFWEAAVRLFTDPDRRVGLAEFKCGMTCLMYHQDGRDVQVVMPSLGRN